MEIKVCVGSACHLKGSYLVIEAIQKFIEEKKLANKIELKASFCLGKCTSNVSILINNELLLFIIVVQVDDNIVAVVEGLSGVDW